MTWENDHFKPPLPNRVLPSEPVSAPMPPVQPTLGKRPTAAEERVARVDERLAGQLQRSIELNARMVTRLQKYARQIRDNGCDSQLAANDLIEISQDKDPWA